MTMRERTRARERGYQRKKTRCRRGAGCRSARCGFGHPADWDPLPPLMSPKKNNNYNRKNAAMTRTRTASNAALDRFDPAVDESADASDDDVRSTEASTARPPSRPSSPPTQSLEKRRREEDGAPTATVDSDAASVYTGKGKRRRRQHRPRKSERSYSRGKG